MPGIRTQLSSPTLTINNKVIAYIPNSLKVMDGNNGEWKVINLTSGGASRNKLLSLDASTLVDKISFDLEVSKESYNDVTAWKALAGTAGVAITISQGTTAKSFDNMTLTIQPEFDFSAEGKVTLEFS